MTYTINNNMTPRLMPLDERASWRAAAIGPRRDHSALSALGGSITGRDLTGQSPDSGLPYMRLVVFSKPRTGAETREFSIFDRVRSTEPSRTATLQSSPMRLATGRMR